jgi:hypothetical protein
MADYFVSGLGSDDNSGVDWLNAKATFSGVVALANVSGDRVIVDAVTPPADIAVNTTWVLLANISVVASTNSGTATVTPTVMGTSAWLGGSSGGVLNAFNLTVQLSAFKVYMYGLTFRNAGGSNVSITFANSDGAHLEMENCYIWQGALGFTGRISFGSGTSGVNSFVSLKNTTLRFGGNTGMSVAGGFEMDGGSVDPAGGIPSVLIRTANNSPGPSFRGVDLSAIVGTLIDSQSGSTATIKFTQCKLNSGVTVMAAQTPANKSSARVWVLDCSSTDTHGLFGYYDAFGSVVSDTGIYYTAGPAGQSWKITTTADCSFQTPFVTPWIGQYNATLSAMTPRFEILRDGSATAYTDAQVWSEWSAKTTSGSTQASFFSDRQALVDWAAGTAGAAQAAGAGLGAWTGESATAWSGKVDTGAAITPAEEGDIAGRIVVGAPSITVYADPFPRT